MKRQKALRTVLALALLILHSVLPLAAGAAGSLSALDRVIPEELAITEPLVTIMGTLKPVLTPTPTPRIFTPKIPTIPTATPALITTRKPKTTPKPTDPPKKTPKPTPKTKIPEGSGQLMTSEGPLFLSFRNDLTEKYWMFTPIDLSEDGQFQYPLVADASHVVGEVKVEVESDLVVVSYMLVNGVTVDSDQEFFTFFTDIASVKTVDPAKLQDVKMRFNIPYHVTSRLNSDPNVLLYINTPLSYGTGLPGLKGFSFQDEGYLRRLADLYPLMD